MEISGGSLGHGLTVAVGMALGLRHQGNGARVINFLSDGELDEGSTWGGGDRRIASQRLNNLIAMVDINALQADGPTVGVLRTEPVACDQWAACGWHVTTDRRQRRRGTVERIRFRQCRSAVGHPVRHQDRKGRATAGKP